MDSCDTCYNKLLPFDIDSNVVLKSYCDFPKNEIAFIPSIHIIFTTLMVFLLLSMILTLYLKKYLDPLHRLWISFYCPFINMVWEPAEQFFHRAAMNGELNLLKNLPPEYLELQTDEGTIFIP